MARLLRRTWLAALAIVLAVGVMPGQSRGQIIQPGFRYPTGIGLNQAVINQGLTGQTFPGIGPVTNYPYANPLFNVFANPNYNPLINPYLNPGINPRALANYYNPNVAAASPLLNPYIAPGGVNPGLLGAAANPYATGAFNPYATAALTASSYSPYSGYGGNSLSSTPYADPYGGGGGYGGYGYYESPLGGYLRGVADIVTSQSSWIKGYEQARLTREQSNKERIENAKRRFDLWLYEREKTPTFEDDRQRLVADQLRRSLNDPPAGEIWSGLALNNILADLSKMAKNSDARGPQIPLDEDVVRHLNFTKGQGGNPGLLKNEGLLNWPQALRSDDYKAERDLLNSLAPETVRQAVNGRVDAGALKEMTDSVQRLQDRLAGNIKDLTPNQYIEARRFLSNFEDALRTLRRPDAGDFFSQKNTADAKSIGDLVNFMLNKGLTFAPAVTGDEAAYMAVHRAMAAYDAGAKAQLATEKPATK
jgi:hypothetical protein